MSDPDLPHMSVATPPFQSAPLWRREPYRLLFPLGTLLSWAGVSHWLLYSVGLSQDYRSIFHAITQIQGFLMCFAVGFLFTMIPRRTGSAAPSAAQMLVAVLAPVVTTACAWFERWAFSQVAWMALAFTVMAFVLARFRASGGSRRPPNSFVWIPASLLMGVLGSILTGIFGVLGSDYQWAHEVGRGLLLQGMFTGLVLGVGGLALPLMTRSEPPGDTTSSSRDVTIRAVHLFGAVVLASSFWVGCLKSLQLAYVMRAAVTLVEVLVFVQLWRFPQGPGWNRRLIWLAAWMLPLGFVFAAAFPLQHKAGLHIVFLGGFALLALSISTQVTLAHGGDIETAQGRPWQVLAIGSLILLAMIPRALMEFDPARFTMWMAAASSLFLFATAIWFVLLGPRFLLRPQEGD